MFTNPVTEKLAAFVRSIGIDVRAAELDEPTFLPGIEIRSGAILVDESRLTYPGDILHEAGHIAVMDPAVRHQPVTADAGEEMAAIAWSYAAARTLEIEPAIVFHTGFKGAVRTWSRTAQLDATSASRCCTGTACRSNRDRRLRSGSILTRTCCA